MSVELVKKLNLSAGNRTEERILDYLEENASEVLVEKINAGKKTLAGALEYAKGEARKLAGRADSICVDDATVFGWIIHFFEEDEIKEPKKGQARGAVRTPGGVKKQEKPEPVKDAKPKKKDNPIIMDLFESMGVKL